MGYLDDLDQLHRDIDAAEEQLRASGAGALLGGGQLNQFELFGKSIGRLIAFTILPAGESGFTHTSISFTDRGFYFIDGNVIPGGTNTTFKGFLNAHGIFYGQGNGMSIAMTQPERTSGTWLTEGVAKVLPSLTGAGTYRGSMLYNWAPNGPFARLNGMPAIFQLVIDELGFTFGTIWRWIEPTSDANA
ncbi:MAG: hypothetical protein JO197_21035 [Acidobacteria bacterium]|nr:hypothetical protein [Acidobacteriota bacterium]MBV9476858.1 hypothetical protein [Acidobacteriota bacterium]